MRISLGLITLLAMTTGAFADPVEFRPMASDAPEAAVVQSFLPEASAISSAVVDLDKDSTAELLARVPDSCNAVIADSCRTLIMRFTGKDWKVVFDHEASVIETGDIGYAGMADILADGVKWTWSSSMGYRIDIATTGQKAEFALAPADYVELLAQQFGDGGLALFRAQTSTKINIAQVSLNEAGEQAVIVRMEGPGVCGVVYGCPWRLLQVKEGAYHTLLEGTGSGAISVMPLTRSGWNDIGAELPGRGFITYGWNGDRYAVSDVVKGAK